MNGRGSVRETRNTEKGFLQGYWEGGVGGNERESKSVESKEVGGKGTRSKEGRVVEGREGGMDEGDKDKG